MGKTLYDLVNRRILKIAAIHDYVQLFITDGILNIYNPLQKNDTERNISISKVSKVELETR